MGITKYLKQSWQNPDEKVMRERMTAWRAGDAVVKIEKPSRLDRARSLGYKAKKGVIVARVKVVRGGHKRMRPKKGRRTKRMHIRKNLTLNYKEIAEMRASKKFRNLMVLNSYNIGKDGKYYFSEVILIDPAKPEIKSDKQLSKFALSPKGRAFRGLTSAGKKARGMRNSRIKSPKVFPSLRSNKRQGN